MKCKTFYVGNLIYTEFKRDNLITVTLAITFSDKSCTARSDSLFLRISFTNEKF